MTGESTGWYPEYREYVKMIQFPKDKEFRGFARSCWRDEVGELVTYNEEFDLEPPWKRQTRRQDTLFKEVDSMVP